MNLGETIYKLRTEKNLSQGNLAEMLDVSRQSISKWENNMAVPDLDKLVKLSEIFEISLDELVKGRKEQQEDKIRDISQPGMVFSTTPQSKESAFPPRKIAGTILLCMSFVVSLVVLVAGGGLFSLIFALPFLLCGVICFLFTENIGLWCTWSIYCFIDLFLRFGTGITWTTIIYTKYWTSDMNFVRLGTAWLQFITLIILIGFTIYRFWNKPISLGKKSRNIIILLWFIFLLISAIYMILPYTRIYDNILIYIMSAGLAYSLISNIIAWFRIIIFTAALVNTIRFFRCTRQNMMKFSHSESDSDSTGWISH